MDLEKAIKGGYAVYTKYSREELEDMAFKLLDEQPDSDVACPVRGLGPGENTLKIILRNLGNEKEILKKYHTEKYHVTEEEFETWYLNKGLVENEIYQAYKSHQNAANNSAATETTKEPTEMKKGCLKRTLSIFKVAR